MVRRRDNSLKLRKTTKQEFESAITSDKGDNFARTFLAKANMQDQWDKCIGAWEEDKLLGAIITTVSIRKPHVANLQLLHSFVGHRGKGVGKILCEYSLRKAIADGASYYRVSSEVPSIGFYERIGFTFLGEQKSKTQLSIFRINGPEFKDGVYDMNDDVIYKAVNRKGKGGCVKIFVDQPEGLSDFL